MKLRVAIAVGLAALAAAESAAATFPGTNGKIAFVSDRDGDEEIFVMNPDGSGQTQLTHNTTLDRYPNWSPDGKRIAFTSSRPEGAGLWLMDADGSDQTYVPLGPPAVSAVQPSWSPDGQQIVFEDQLGVGPSAPAGDIAIVNVDGTGLHYVSATVGDEIEPSWSPDGSKIAFSYHGCDPKDGICDAHSEIVWVSPSGASGGNVTNHGFSYRASVPTWSPDSARIAFDACYFPDTCDFDEVHLIDADGSDRNILSNTTNFRSTEPVFSPDGQKLAYVQGQEQSPGIIDEEIYVDGVAVTDNTARDTSPDWQPIPIGFPRPRGASPMYVSLVPAYAPCTSPNRTHGAPLSFPSCTPPAHQSTQLTVGTPDVNARSANSVGSVVLAAKVGNLATPADEADVRVTSSITDVRRRTDLADYTGELGLRLPLQITDRNNTGAGPATVQPTEAGLSIPCMTTSSTSVGATCAIATTIEAVIPGAVVEQTRNLWELGEIRVEDGGSDGDADTPGNGTFAVQGVFIP